jgi:TPR repeat protein
MVKRKAARRAWLMSAAVGCIGVAILMLVAFQTPAAAESGQRVALVIGKSTYQSVTKIPNAANDARLVAQTLTKLGFKLVGDGPQIDIDKARFDTLIQAFGTQIAGADVALFYYAGHGMQIRGTNFLVPISANPVRETDVDFQMVDTALVLRQMEAGNTKLNMLILDACRNNPFSGRGLRGVGGGLAQMVAPLGTLISYATQPGNVAADGADGDSPYTKALVTAMQVPGRGLFDVFNQVGLAVKASTGGEQQPWVSSSPIEGQFYFVPPGAPVTIQTPPVPTPVPGPAPGPDAELLFWQTIATSRDPADFKAYLDQYPNGRFVALARPRAIQSPAPTTPVPTDRTTDDTSLQCDTLAGSTFDDSLPSGVRGLPPERVDPATAIPACERAVAMHPTPRMQFELARAYGAARRDADAVRFYAMASEQGYALAQVNLANMYLNGQGGLTKNAVEAVRLYKLAAAQGQSVAQTSLGLMYESGQGGLERSVAEAARLYRLAAAQDFARAQTALGLMYASGRGGVAHNDAEAVRLYRLAAAQGFAPALTNLGWLYQNGTGGLPHDEAEAVRLFKLAAEQSYPRAEANLAIMYETGRGGLPRDMTEAVRLAKLASSQGFAPAQNYVGWLYESGTQGTPKDEREAARLYQLAAGQGDARAQIHLGLMYATGRGGLPRNRAEAIRLYHLAEAQEPQLAREALRQIGQ